MRLIFIILALITSIFAQNVEFKTFKSDFVQTITSPESAKIVYHGKFFIKQPDLILWHYTKPVDKSIYFTHKKIFILEPLLEQVIVSSGADIPNFSALLKSAKKISKNRYKASFDGTLYTITTKNEAPLLVEYKDKLDDRVSISFIDAKKDIPLKDSLFKVKIPNHYDILHQ